jgi:uncharacterized protein
MADAGGFSAWLAGMAEALAGRQDADVPCDGCTACCRASQFIHVGPDEVDARSHIPAELLFPAPGLPPGHHVMGYDEQGHCPMLVEDRCSIYDHRPRTCRTYDCRVFAATGLDGQLAEDPASREIATRAAQWEFALGAEQDQLDLVAVRTAAAFLADHPEVLAEAARPFTTTQLAVQAVELHDVFVGDPSDVAVELARRTQARPGG